MQGAVRTYLAYQKGRRRQLYLEQLPACFVTASSPSASAGVGTAAA